MTWLEPRGNLMICGDCWRYKHVDLDLHRCKGATKKQGKWLCHCPCLLRS